MLKILKIDLLWLMHEACEQGGSSAAIQLTCFDESALSAERQGVKSEKAATRVRGWRLGKQD